MGKRRIEASSVADRQKRPESRLSFGPFVLDPEERTLRRQGIEVSLPDRSLRLLEVLACSAGETVPKGRLLTEVWQGAYVSETSLTEAMSRLRRALGDDAREPRYIRTVHRRGYRFIAAVNPPSDGIGGGEPLEAPRTPASLAASIAAWAAPTIALLGLFWLASVAVDDSHRQEVGAGGSSGVTTATFFERIQGWGQELLAPPRSDDRVEPPRYRLAEVTMSDDTLVRYAVPALPLNDLSVDRTGERLAFSVADDDESAVWVLEPRRGDLERVASGGYYSDPVWTPDGRALAMAMRRDDGFDLVLHGTGGEAPPRILLDAPLDQFPESWSRDGRSLVYAERHPETGYDLWLLRRQSDDGWSPSPLVRSPADEAFGAISPDGRYVAYTAGTGRRFDVFVVDLEGDRSTFRVSRGGGAYPFWSAAGDRLHYVKDDDVWTVAADQLGSAATRPSRRSTTVTGLYLAGTASTADRLVVAMLE